MDGICGSCVTGYIGDSSSNTACDIVTCPSYSPPTGYVTVGSCGNTYGTNCDLQCDSGYTGSAIDAVCQSDGVWTVPTGCSVDNGEGSGALSGYNVSIVCVVCVCSQWSFVRDSLYLL